VSTETEEWAKRLEDRAKYLAHQAWVILFFVLCLAGLAVAVFFFAASITKSDLSASDIDSKLNASTSTIAKLSKDQDSAVQDVEARAGEVASKIKDVGEHFGELSPSTASLTREDDPQAPAVDLAGC
jgi:ABC-type Na+ efflux pump permease subunit